MSPFAYEQKKTVLHDISFRARPGTVTALVGSSGSGKSTIIGLIAAFHTPNQGKILVDSVDLATVRLESYRTQLGMVLQDSFLFDGSIRENVAFSKPNATTEEILRACAIARVDEFAEKFDLQYDTIIGERGVKLSGGQRQRVSIARAILADPRILILDEATSSLDSESEALIQEGLSYLMQGRTTFVIAHRLSTIRRADQILVVEEGRSSNAATTNRFTSSVAATTSCTPSNTASKRISSWRRERATQPKKLLRYCLRAQFPLIPIRRLCFVKPTIDRERTPLGWHPVPPLLFRLPPTEHISLLPIREDAVSSGLSRRRLPHTDESIWTHAVSKNCCAARF